MPTITITDDSDCYCKDWSEGRPVVFWPNSPAQAPTGDLQ
jgi:hypothetical protein